MSLTEPRLLYGLKAERAGNDEIIRRIRDNEIPISALSDGGAKIRSRRPAIGSWVMLIVDDDRAALLEWSNEAVAIARRPAAERPSLARVWDSNVSVRHSRLGFFTTTLPIALLFPLSGAIACDSHFDSGLRATAILLAAERHRRKTGAWPASIAAIDREILPAAPIDVFSGQTFRMEHRDGQLFV